MSYILESVYLCRVTGNLNMEVSAHVLDGDLALLGRTSDEAGEVIDHV